MSEEPAGSETEREYIELGRIVHDALCEVIDGMVVGFHIVVELIDSEGERAQVIDTMPNQGLMQTMGQLTYSLGLAKHEQRRNFEMFDYDEEGE